MPNRFVPEVHEFDEHEPSGPRQNAEPKDIDWTLYNRDYTRADWETQLRRREQRDNMIKAKLLAGKWVAYRSSGWSLHPRVKNQERCVYRPITNDDIIAVGDIVFCQVQRSNWFYAHLVLEILEERQVSGPKRYIIGNIKGHVNGWCNLKHIYGKLVRVEQ
jgi:hypothetical protein